MAKRVMVVDDSRVIHLQIQQLLKDSDFEVAVCCRDGESAIEQYDAVQPDVVTMDIIMPGMDGLETARAILEDHPDAKIVMVSSLAYDDAVNEARQLGAVGFIFKPFDREPLLAALEKALKA